MYVFVHVIDEQPEKCGAEKRGKDECDDEACVRHDDKWAAATNGRKILGECREGKGKKLEVVGTRFVLSYAFSSCSANGKFGPKIDDAANTVLHCQTLLANAATSP